MHTKEKIRICGFLGFRLGEEYGKRNRGPRKAKRLGEKELQALLACRDVVRGAKPKALKAFGLAVSRHCLRFNRFEIQAAFFRLFAKPQSPFLHLDYPQHPTGVLGIMVRVTGLVTSMEALLSAVRLPSPGQIGSVVSRESNRVHDSKRLYIRDK